MRFMGALSEHGKGSLAIIGAPFDGTASYRSGSRFGPNAIREASSSLETYSPFLDASLDDMDYCDWGDLELPPGSAVKTVELVNEAVNKAYSGKMKPLLLGGEHTITLGAIQSAVKYYPDLHILQLDAHTDLRDEYMGEKLSHATVMRRILDYVDKNRITHFGIRAGTREELEGSGILLPLGMEGGHRDVERIQNTLPVNKPIYVTIDLDVFDPSLLPGTGNPEPLGITYREYIQIVRVISRLNIVGADVVELSPHYDQTGVSSIVAASVVRELLLAIANSDHI